VGICSALYAGVISSASTPDLQELLKVRESGKFDKAVWMRGTHHYSLQILPLRPSVMPEASRATPAEAQPLPGTPGPTRGEFFLGNTIANLRGLDPVIDPPRILTLIDPRRVVSTAQQSSNAQPPPAKPTIQVWLLRADGSQIVPTVDARYMLYSVPAAEATAAVAAAIQIDDQYYIEKLQPLSAPGPRQPSGETAR
jgi:hypothetical protein